MANFQSSFLSTVSEKVTWVSISGEFPLNKRMPIFTTSASNPFSCPQMPMQRWATDQCTNNLWQGCNGSCQWCDLPIWMEQTEQCNTMQRKALRNATKKLRKYLVLPGASWFDPVLLAGRVWESYSRSQEIHLWNDLIILILTHRQLIGSSWSKLAHRLLFAEVRLLLLFNHLRILSWRAPSFPVDPASWNPTRTCARCCTCTAWPGHCFKREEKLEMWWWNKFVNADAAKFHAEARCMRRWYRSCEIRKRQILCLPLTLRAECHITFKKPLALESIPQRGLSVLQTNYTERVSPSKRPSNPVFWYIGPSISMSCKLNTPFLVGLSSLIPSIFLSLTLSLTPDFPIHWILNHPKQCWIPPFLLANHHFRLRGPNGHGRGSSTQPGDGHTAGQGIHRPSGKSGRTD